MAAVGALLDQRGGGASIEARLEFSLFDTRPAIDGALRGTVVMTCQRCMQGMPVVIEDGFKVILVPEERADEPSGYEQIGRAHV